MARPMQPGVLADRWPWGLPLAFVSIPKHLAQSYCDLSFVIVRSIEQDIGDRPYKDAEGVWPQAQILTRREAPNILEQQGLSEEEVQRIMVEVDRILGLP